MGGYDYTLEHIRHYRCDMELTGGTSTRPSSLTEEMDRTAYKTFQAVADYNITLANKHAISATVGYTWEDESQRTLQGYRINFPSDNVPYLT